MGDGAYNSRFEWTWPSPFREEQPRRTSLSSRTVLYSLLATPLNRSVDALEGKVRTKLLRAAIVLALVVATFGGGYTLGTLRMFRWMVESLSAETRGNLSQRVETLARLRTGDGAGAIEILERAVDTAAVTLPQGRSFSELSSETPGRFADRKGV